MKPANLLTYGRTGLLLGAASMTALLLTGCVYDETSRPSGYHERRVVVAQDDYVYYPQYEVYYSNSRRQYYYRDGNAWVWRPAPPHVAVNVLFSSPSVRMDFHDAPEHHHQNVIRTYPRNWRGDKDHDGKNDRREDRRDDRRDDRKDDRRDDRRDDRKN